MTTDIGILNKAGNLFRSARATNCTDGSDMPDICSVRIVKRHLRRGIFDVAEFISVLEDKSRKN